MDSTTKNLVRAAAGLIIVATVGALLFVGFRHLSKKASGNYCANVDVPARCPGDVCSQQDKLAVFSECMAERGHAFR